MRNENICDLDWWHSQVFVYYYSFLPIFITGGNATFLSETSENKVQRASEFYPWAFWKPVNPGEKHLKPNKGKYLCEVYFKDTWQ